MSDMKLIMENWNKFQLVTEAQVIHALCENQTITEAEFMDRIKRFAKKKGIPLAVALSLATGAMAPSAAQAAPDDAPVQVDQAESTATTVDVTVPMRGNLQSSMDRAGEQARLEGAAKLNTSPENVSVQRTDVQMGADTVTVSFNVSVK
jgi:hypothetical protein